MYQKYTLTNYKLKKNYLLQLAHTKLLEFVSILFCEVIFVSGYVMIYNESTI